MKSHQSPGGCAVIGSVLFLIMVAAWFTHVAKCLSEESWGFLIAGAIAFPIAIVHGFGIWLGIW